ncbi:MAG: hypothetical protein KBD39_07140 [Sterolibacterium sp.]|nr:hypothetical protein [Sterolibacterium sp.]MBP9799878.1 hypothetical protein [Sterolibacterium sp.]
MLILNPQRLLAAVLVFIAALIAGCGGGSGASGSTSTDTGNTTPPSPTLVLTMTATRGGTDTVSTVTAGTSAYLNIVLKEGTGTPVSGAVVTFTVPASLLSATPVAATALTDEKGKASIQIDAIGTTAAGAGSVSATASWGKDAKSYTAESGPLGFAVGSAAVTLGVLNINPSNVSAYGSTSISIPVLVNGSPATVPISVSFTSGCVGSGKASITSPVTTVNGVATTTYKDTSSCASNDTVTASVAGTSAVATASVAVAAPAANNVQFVEAAPSVIGITGTGLPTSSIVKFKVVDANNNGVAGKLVNLTLTPNLAAGSVSLSATSASSDADGTITVSLTSGTVPTPVWVVATLAENSSIRSQSTALTVTTGLPTQDFLSLSISKHNIEGWNIDGTTTQLNIIASDRLGNPVPDGTAINFVTEGGQIQGGTGGQATCATQSGNCSLTLKSANSRPANGRVTILAYAVGEKSFVDTNANNTWDAGETFYDLGDPFIDNDEDNAWDSGEQSWSYASGTQSCGTHLSGGSTVTSYPDAYSDAPSKTNTCSGTMTSGTNRAYVRRLGIVTFSGSYADTPSTTTFSMGNSCRRTFSLDVRDMNNNPMPVGTTISTANEYVIYQALSTGEMTAATITINNSTVPDTTNVGGTTHSFTIDGGTKECPGGVDRTYPQGSFDLKITAPSGATTLIPITIN